MTDPFVMAVGRKGVQGPGLYVVLCTSSFVPQCCYFEGTRIETGVSYRSDVMSQS